MPQTAAQLTPEQFTAYTEAWQAVADGGNDDALRAAFADPSGLLTRATLTVAETRALIAASEAGPTAFVKIRFLLVPGKAGGRFALALYGTDAAGAEAPGERTTDYYLAAATNDPQSMVPPNPIPDKVAQEWRAAWETLESNPDDFTLDLFAVEGEEEHLRGYNFPVQDFIDVLEPLTSEYEAKVELRVYFGRRKATAQCPAFVVVVALGSPENRPLPPEVVAYYDQALSVPPAL